MADEGTIEIGDTTLDTPIGYTHDPKDLASHEYSIGGNLLTTRIVTAENQPKSKYTFFIRIVTTKITPSYYVFVKQLLILYTIFKLCQGFYAVFTVFLRGMGRELRLINAVYNSLLVVVFITITGLEQ